MGQGQSGLIGDECGVPCVQSLAVHLQFPTHQVHIGLAGRVQRQLGLLVAVEQPCVQRSVRMDLHRAGCAVG